MKLLKQYKQTIILLLSLIIGSIIGIIFKDKASILSPFGDLFINMMYVIIIPLIFFTITTTISKINNKRITKLLLAIIFIFLITSLISVLVGLITTSSIKLVNNTDTTKIINKLDYQEEDINLNILERTVKAISVSDFNKLLSKNAILPLVIISLLVGIAIRKVGSSSEPLIRFLESANKVTLKLLDIIFLYAPIGLGCYFASLIGSFGKSIATGYLKTFIIYLVVSILFYFIIYSIYALISAGKKGFISFWKNILPSTVTSLSTCSSAASIPINIKCTKNIGVSNDIAETTIPLGTSFHKDGSIIGSVFKIMFLVYLFNSNVSIITIIGVSLLANLLVIAVPIGGGTISEMLIISLLGFPTSALPILTIIATIIDPPATVLNVVGDSASSMLIARIIDGKYWIKKRSSN